MKMTNESKLLTILLGLVFLVAACGGPPTEPLSAPQPINPSENPTQAAGTSDKAPMYFDVILKEIGSQKIQVIKEVRAITGLGLKKAKALVDEAPKPIKEGVDEDEANQIREKIEAVGAVVEIKRK